MNKTILGDCLIKMKDISDESIDLIKTDLPFGMTQNPWDKLIKFEPLWLEYNRIIKPAGVIALNAIGKFAAKLILSNERYYRYDWVWYKTKATGHLNAETHPLRAHEQVLIFYKNLPVYNPQKTTGHTPVNSFTKHQTDGDNYGATKTGISGGGQTDRFPISIQKFKADTQKSALHRTQKPVCMEEYFIETYTNPGMLVLDSCAGSGSVAIACLNKGRNYICIEKDPESFDKMNNRILEYYKDLL